MMVIYKLGSQASEEASPADILFLDVQPPENKFLWLEPPSLGAFIWLPHQANTKTSPEK